jgi:hypothetical protein
MHFEEEVMNNSPSAIEKYLDVVVQAGLLHSAKEIRSLVEANADIIEEATIMAVKEFKAGRRSPSELFALLDSSRSLTTKHMLTRRSFKQTSGKEVNFVILQTKPNIAEQYISLRFPDTAIVSFYVHSHNTISVLVARDAPGRAVGYNVVHIDSLKDDFMGMLVDYAISLNDQRPDFSLQEELLKVIGGVIFVSTMQPKPPRKIVLIPHKLLHLLPIHAAFTEIGGHRLYLHDVVGTISYASSAIELVYGYCYVPSDLLGQSEKVQEKSTGQRFLAALDLDAGLSWIDTEMKYAQILRADLESNGMHLDIVNNLDNMPKEMESYFWINWSSHAKSSPLNWGSSYLAFGSDKISANTILDTWNLTSRPTVVLAACESAVDSSGGLRMDEYCGLDLAFHVAGARATIATLWPVIDPVAAFTAVTLPSWCLHYDLSPDLALTQLQRHLRQGKWKDLLLSKEQIENAPAAIQHYLEEAQESFHGLPAEAFKDHSSWAVFRCHGD